MGDPKLSPVFQSVFTLWLDVFYFMNILMSALLNIS